MAIEKKLTRGFALFLTTIFFSNGLVAFLAYFLNTHLKIYLPALVVINPISALSFVLNGLWIFLYFKNPRQAKVFQLYVALIIIACSIFKIFELTGVIGSNFDRWLFWGIMNTTEYFKPMGPNSTTLLLLSGLTVLLAYKKTDTSLLISDIVKVTGFLLSYTVVIGYIYKLEIVYKVGDFVPLALNTAIGYILFFIVTIITLPSGNLLKIVNTRHLGSKMARSAIPVILLIPILLGSVKIFIEQIIVSYYRGNGSGSYDTLYGTAIESGLIMLVILAFVIYYAQRLNQQDIKRRIAEIQTTNSEKKYRTLVNALREGVIYFNNNGIISFCNASFLKIAGYDENEVVGKNIFDFFIETDFRDNYAKNQRRDMAELSKVYEEHLRTNKGDTIWVSISLSPVFDDNNHHIASLATVVDITERKKQLEDIEAYSASAAHDLNAPLARIEMIALLLLDSIGEGMDPENKELLEAIAGITSNMRALLKDLLQFSKLGVSTIIKNEIDIDELVNEVIAANKHINPKAAITTYHIPKLRGDRPMLKQVFTNLISNALKYSGQKEKPVVEIGYKDDNGKVVIYIKDNGAGFDMNEAHKLFAAFQRLHVEFEGNGLGLPIVKRIIEKHGGKIWALGKPGEGAIFYFTLN